MKPIYFANSSEPHDSWPLERCRAARDAGEGYFINHGNALRLIEKICPALDEISTGFSDTWAIIPSGGYPVWQMRS